MPLPYLRFPHLVQQNVHESLDLKTIIELSLLSRRMKSFVRTMEALKNDSKMTVSLGKSGKVFVLEDGSRGSFKMAAYSDRCGSVVDQKDFIKRKADGRDWTMGVDSVKWLCIGGRFPEENLIFWIQYLRSFINFTITNAKIDFSRGLDFDKTLRDTQTLHKANEFRFEQCSLSQEELTYLLDHVEAGELGLYVNPGSRFVYNRVPRALKFDSSRSGWVTEEVFLEMAKSMEKVYLRDSVLVKINALNQFLKYWMTSDNQSLKLVKLQSHENRNPPQVRAFLNWQLLLKDIPFVRGAPKSMEASEYYDPHVEYEKGKDLTRRDGKVATVLMDVDRSEASFTFIVWDDPSPNEEDE